MPATTSYGRSNGSINGSKKHMRTSVEDSLQLSFERAWLTATQQTPQKITHGFSRRGISSEWNEEQSDGPRLFRCRHSVLDGARMERTGRLRAIDPHPCLLHACRRVAPRAFVSSRLGLLYFIRKEKPSIYIRASRLWPPVSLPRDGPAASPSPPWEGCRDRRRIQRQGFSGGRSG